MGINMDPTLPIYGNDCLRCFGAGATPKNVFMTVSGMKTGDLWDDSQPPPPNGSRQLVQTGNPCFWQKGAGAFIWGFELVIGASTASVFYLLGEVSFFGVNPNECQWSMANASQAPAGRVYYGGSASIVTVGPAEMPSVADAAEQLNIETDKKTFAEIVNVPGPNVCIRRAKFKTPMNILILAEEDEI